MMAEAVVISGIIKFKISPIVEKLRAMGKSDEISRAKNLLVIMKIIGQNDFLCQGD